MSPSLDSADYRKLREALNSRLAHLYENSLIREGWKVKAEGRIREKRRLARWSSDANLCRFYLLNVPLDCTL